MVRGLDGQRVEWVLDGVTSQLILQFLHSIDSQDINERVVI